MREAVQITFGRQVYLLRPTFAAYGDIEARLGSLRTVYTTVASGTATLEAMAFVAYVGMNQVDGQKADPKTGIAITEEGVAMGIFENGAWDLEATIKPLSDFLAALGWTPEQRKKIDAGMDEETGEPSLA